MSRSATRRQLQRFLAGNTYTASSTTTSRAFSILSSPVSIHDFRSPLIGGYQRRTRRLGEGIITLNISYRPQSTLTSNAIWKSLDDAVEHGDGATAQEIVDQVVQEYQNRIRNGPALNGNSHERERLDARMFSMVLQAWKNEASISIGSALRAQKVLGRMIVLAEEGLIDDRPTLEDHLSVLECWSRASEKDDMTNPRLLKHTEVIWEMVQQKEGNISPFFQEKFHKVYLDILASAGRGEQAEECLEEYKRQHLEGGNTNNADPTYAKSKGGNDVTVSTDMCLTVLKAHVRSPETRGIERAEEFLRTMRDDKLLPHPDVSAYNIVLDGWISAAKRDYAITAGRVENLLAEMKNTRVQPNAASYQYGLEILARMGEGERAEALLTSLLKEYMNQFDADLKPDIVPFRTVLLAYSNCHHPDAASRAESVLNNMTELGESEFDTFPTTLDYNLVLKCWVQSRSPDAVERAMKLYGEMVSTIAPPDDVSGRMVQPPLPDTTSLNTMLNVSSHHEQAHQTEKLLWKFFDRHFQDPSRNPCPDTISFCTVMKSWSQARDHDAPERAEKLLKKLEELYQAGNERCKPDLYAYSILMNCWNRATRSRKEAPLRAESIFRRLHELARNGSSEMAPDVACWNVAISAWIDNGERAEALFMEMLENHRSNPNASPAPNAKTLTKVFHAWAKTRSRDASDRAVALLNKLEQFHNAGLLSIKPHVICYSLVLEALSQDRRLSSAIFSEEMLRKMATSQDPAMRPILTCYNWVIKAWSFAAHPEAVSRVTALLKEVIRESERNEKMKPNEKTFGGVLKALSQSNLPDKQSRAEAVVALMEKFGCKPDKWIQNVLQDCYVGQSGRSSGTEGQSKKNSAKKSASIFRNREKKQ